MSLNAMLQEAEVETDLTIHPTTSWGEIRTQRVVVTGTRIPFPSAVALLMKWAIAAVPAALLLGALIAGTVFVLQQVLGLTW